MHGKNRYDAIAKGLKWYKARRACEYGHIGLRRTYDCQCRDCLELRPRAPRKWYKSSQPCHRGHKGLRRSADGRCKKCLDMEKRRLARTVPADQRGMMAAAPGAIISKTDAKMAGLRVYRTGEACALGHNDWRYVVNGICVICHSK